MYVKKNFNLIRIVRFSWFHMVWLTLWSFLVAMFYGSFSFEWMKIPWLPLSVLGTAVAFYIGFKNNSAYDRLWEARKIWGSIVNTSRMLVASTRAYASNLHADKPTPQNEIDAIIRRFTYRHIGWLYALRSQLLIPTPWEHLRTESGSKFRRQFFERRKNRIGVGLFSDYITDTELRHFLPAEEHDRLVNFKNTATQILDQQSQDLKSMREKGLIDDFRHMELQKLVNDFYTHQGKCERIKKFPLPRQYASMSFVFVSIFIILLPFGLVPAFQELSPNWGHWISIPFVALVGWVFVMMELIGDYSENPFEGLANDIPMLSLCRTIEIDLLEMIGETNIPEPVLPINHTLM